MAHCVEVITVIPRLIRNKNRIMEEAVRCSLDSAQESGANKGDYYSAYKRHFASRIDSSSGGRPHQSTWSVLACLSSAD